MKKALIFLFAFIFALGFVNAQDVTVGGDSSQNVTVGDVDTPVYEVEIGWSNMVYDWAYLADTGTYGWRVHPGCSYADIENAQGFENYTKQLYTDNTCTTEATTYDSETDYYYVDYDVASNIWIVDVSAFGRITPSINYTINNAYNFTTMSFTYDGLDGAQHSLSTGTIPDAARICAAGEIDEQTGAIDCGMHALDAYSINPKLEIDTSKTITTPTSGATIGTITVTFATN